MGTERKNSAVTLGDALAEVLASLPAISDEREAEVAAERAAAQARQDARHAVFRLSEVLRWGVPLEHAQNAADGPGELASSPALEAAAKFAQTGGRILVLSGGPGCGKSTAAAVWVGTAPPAGSLPLAPGSGQPMWLPFSSLQAVSRYRRDELAPLERARRLVVDDLGSEYLDNHGAFASLLDGLLVDRFGNLRPTVITTNLDATTFKARYGERIADRIRGAGRFVDVNGPSFRRRTT